MKISDILKETLIVPALNVQDKEGVLREMSACLAQHLGANVGADIDSTTIRQALLAREQLGSTGVGEGVAIPHAKIPHLGELVACFGRAPLGVAFDAIDYQPVHLIFVLLVPENSAGAHLKALARISRLLKNSDFRQQLLDLEDQGALFNAFVREDDRN